MDEEMGKKSRKGSEKFAIFIFALIAVTSLFMYLYNFFQGSKREEQKISLWQPLLFEREKTQTYPQDVKEEVIPLSSEGEKFTGIARVFSKYLFINARLPEIIQGYSYEIWLSSTGKDEQPVKKIGVLKKEFLGNYTFEKELTKKEMEFLEIFITLSLASESFEKSAIILSGKR